MANYVYFEPDHDHILLRIQSWLFFVFDRASAVVSKLAINVNYVYRLDAILLQLNRSIKTSNARGISRHKKLLPSKKNGVSLHTKNENGQQAKQKNNISDLVKCTCVMWICISPSKLCTEQLENMYLFSR